MKRSFTFLPNDIMTFVHPKNTLIQPLAHQLQRLAGAESLRDKVAAGEAGGGEAERRPRHDDGLRGTQVHHQGQGRSHLPGHHRATGTLFSHVVIFMTLT